MQITRTGQKPKVWEGSIIIHRGIGRLQTYIWLINTMRKYTNNNLNYHCITILHFWLLTLYKQKEKTLRYEEVYNNTIPFEIYFPFGLTAARRKPVFSIIPICMPCARMQQAHTQIFIFRTWYVNYWLLKYNGILFYNIHAPYNVSKKHIFIRKNFCVFKCRSNDFIKL